MGGSHTIRGIVLTLAATVQATAVAQSNAARTAFEVASIREHRGTVFRSGPLSVADPLSRLEGYRCRPWECRAKSLDRFKLRVHSENREMQSLTGAHCSVRVGLQMTGVIAKKFSPGVQSSGSTDRIGNLPGDRPVLDRTVLSGRYVFVPIQPTSIRSPLSATRV